MKKSHTMLIVLPADVHTVLVREARKLSRSTRSHAAHLLAAALEPSKRNDAYHEILCREILNPLNSAVRTEFQALIKRLRLELDGREDETSAASRREAIQRHEQACRTRERAQSELTERLRSMSVYVVGTR